MIDLPKLRIADLLERLAELEHRQWTEWSITLAEKESLSDERLNRWEKLWVPYVELPEATKEQDREWARKAYAVFEEERASAVRLLREKLRELQSIKCVIPQKAQEGFTGQLDHDDVVKAIDEVFGGVEK